MKLLDKLPLVPLFFIAILLGLAPFGSQPHLLEKLGMLFSAELSRPIDIFDLFLHGTPALLLFLKLFSMVIKPRDTQV